MSPVQGSLFDDLPEPGTSTGRGGGTAATADSETRRRAGSPAGTAEGPADDVAVAEEVADVVGPVGDAATVLQPWRDAGVLQAADVHIATTLARLGRLGDADGVLDPVEAQVLLAIALAARAPRHGHVCLDLASVRRSVPAEIEGDADAVSADAVERLPWPRDIGAWRDVVGASALVAEIGDGGAPISPIASGRGVPLVLDGTLLYLERYHVYEDRVAAELQRRARVGAFPAPSDPAARSEPGDRSDPTDRSASLTGAAGAGIDASPEQLVAAERGARGLLSVIVGGPGTGKTTTVAVLLARLLAAAPSTRIALAAPTGKAAARMGESIAALAAELRARSNDEARVLADRLSGAEVSTVHRLLGARPDGTFRHGRRNPLVHDVVIVDETSMVSLPLLAHLLDAVRADARLVLVGDPGQLASVEAGSVLGDIAGPAVDAALDGEPAPPGEVTNCVSVLTRSYRFPVDSSVGRFAAAVRLGDADTAIAVLREVPAARSEIEEESGATGSDVGTGSVAGAAAGLDGGVGGGAGFVAGAAAGLDGGVGGGARADGTGGANGVRLRWVAAGADTEPGTEAVREFGLGAARRTLAAAHAGDAAGALDALGSLRVLCAHRRGPFGVARWNWQFEEWLAGALPHPWGFYVGRPVLVTANDPVSGLANGDLGVVVAAEPAPRVAFPSAGEARLVAPSRLEAVETVHAMTIHKSQGSEFDEVVVILPSADSRLATRELLYTAVTRARHGVTLIGGEAALRRAVANRVVRQSGLRARLWPDLEGPTRGRNRGGDQGRDRRHG